MKNARHFHLNRRELTRREFLKSLVGIAAGSGLLRLRPSPALSQDDPPPKVYLPLVAQYLPPSMLHGWVVHVHASSATNWDFDSAHYYGRTQAPGVLGVSQDVVDAMVDQGVTGLLSLPASAVAEAWRLLTPDYTPGMLIAIKINLNNSPTCSSATSAIDAIAQPINSVLRGLILRGVRQQDIVLYDAIRYFPDRLYNELAYKGVQIHDKGCHGHTTTWTSSNADAIVRFNPPSGSLPTVRLSDTLINAAYLINMPIIKCHSIAGVTLGFKNHFGSTNNPGGMHGYVSTGYADIAQYNALVDLYANRHIRSKTVLTIGDGIYGSRGDANTPPQRWTTFDDQSPCSLFFATDPVAIDCVMHDLLKAERIANGSPLPVTSNYYLQLAESAGLGIFESGDPWQTPYGSGYAKLVYKKIEI
jgi:hypothetical protein